MSAIGELGSMMAERDTAGVVLPLRLEGVGYGVAGRALLADITVELQAGVRSVVVGPNGAGKSLLLRLCHGLLKPTSGRLYWAAGSTEQQRRAQAMVFQKPVLLRRSAAANIDYALAVHGVARRERAAQVERALHEAGLLALARRPARVLSGGEQQRLALARAWALRPQVLFLDEPSAHLDPSATRAVETMLSSIVAAGTTIVMTTHDLGQARRLGDEILFLHDGRLRERASVQKFFNSPGSDVAAAFIEGRLLV